MGIFDRFRRKRAGPGERKSTDYDLNGNRFYREYIIEGGVRADAKPLKLTFSQESGCYENPFELELSTEEGEEYARIR